MNGFTNFAVMSYSFHGLRNIGAMDIFGYLETVRYRYNLQTADIWNGMLDSTEAEYIQKVKNAIDERGLEVVNFCCDRAHVWDNDPKTREENEQRAWEYIQVGKALGAKTIRIDVGIREDQASEEQIEYVAGKYKEYCRAAAKFGAKLGPENHWGASWDPELIEALFQRVDEPNFGLLLHLGNWFGSEEEKDACDRRFASKAMHIHMNYEHCMDADRVLPPLKEAGYQGCWSIESHKSTNEYNNVAFQLAQARRVLAPLNYDGSWKVAPPSVLPDT